MKQVVQNLRSGVLERIDVPRPGPSSGQLLIRTRASLISAGTERFVVEFGKASLMQKARQNPERVRQVLNKIKADGLLPTLEAVFHKLDQPLPLGYCNAGVVEAVGSGVHDWRVGDRVASNGHHAEWVSVPVNLCARIPEGVADHQAAFAVLGAIGMQGVRLLTPQIGETVVVFGLGLVGQLVVQLLAASGARVLGIDLNANRLALARRFGAVTIHAGQSDVVRAVQMHTGGMGADGVLITASAKNDNILRQSAQMARKRGRLVLVGVVNMELDRTEFYEKELSFQVSCSYGPGRYDPSYEDQGHDYPYAFVRWTEQRNIQCVLDLMAAGRLDVEPLISHRFAFDEAEKAYALLSESDALGVVLEYPRPATGDDTESTGALGQDESAAIDDSASLLAPEDGQTHTAPRRAPCTTPAPGKSFAGPAAIDRDAAEGGPSGHDELVHPAAGRVVAGIIGAGGFTSAMLLPALARTGAKLEMIASRGGLSAAHAARKYAIGKATADYREILDHPDINTVVVATRHHQHAAMAIEALEAGKHVFVEKPLCLTLEQLEAVRQTASHHPRLQLMVGFNRRFAPLIERLVELLQGRSGPLVMVMHVNAGYLPKSHWTQDPDVGGGRLIGEGCHFVDLLRFLARAPVSQWQVASVGPAAGIETRSDHLAMTMVFQDGSLGTVHYLANGHRSFPKERLTVSSDGMTLELDNFRVLTGYGVSSFGRQRLWRQDKGHARQLAKWIDRVASGGPPLIPRRQLWEVSELVIRAQQHLDGLASPSADWTMVPQAAKMGS